MIAGMEALGRHLDLAKVMELRRLVQGCMTDAKPPKPNLTKQQSRALNSLCRDDSIVVLPADKGNASVIMETSKYQHKIDEIL